MRSYLLTSVLSLMFLVAHVHAGEIRVLAWNLESDRYNSDTNDPEVIADWLESFDGYDIFALSEVAEENAIRYVKAIARDEGAFFFYKVGDHNANDHLMLVWDSFKFDTLELLELDGEEPGEDDLQLGSGGRAPLAVRLREKPDGSEFWIIVNHFHRSTAWKRDKQSEGVRDWIIEQDIPVFAVGDYNFDWNISTESGNEAFDIMFAEPGVTWVEPAEKVRTEDSHNSILDFVLVNDLALEWSPMSRIIVREDDFIPENEKSDHRPVTTAFWTPSPTTSDSVTDPALDVIEAFADRDAVQGSVVTGDLFRDKVSLRQGREPEPESSAREQLIFKQIKLMQVQLDLLEALLREEKEEK